MLRTLILLVATLAVVALAAPAPKPQSSSGWGWPWGSGSKHSFKASTHGHRSRHHGRRNPLAEVNRIYSKFHWSITFPISGTTLSVDWPSNQSYGSSGSGDSSYGSPEDSNSPSDGSASGSSGGENSPPSYGSPEGSASPSGFPAGSDNSTENSPFGVPGSVSLSSSTTISSYITISSSTDAAAATPPDSYATESAYAVAPSSNVIEATSTFATRTSAAASPSATASNPSTGGGSGDDSDTGEVAATPEENESEYLSPVTIGSNGQKLNLNFDTGSADLWVFSTSLSSSQLGDHSAFNPDDSESWEPYEEGSWDISYGDGSGASGTVGYDTVNVGGATATRQAVELATVVSSAFVSDENNDGLLGLAFGKINTIEPQKQKSFFENIADQLDEKLFTADLDIDASGTYEFGKLDKSKYQGELHTTPIDNSQGFWQFSSSAYSINGKDVQNPNASPAIADTGTSLIMVDEDIAEAFYAQIEGSSMSSDAGGYVYPCDAEVPSFGVQIGDSGFMAHINGSDVEYANVGRNTCFGGVQGNGGQGLQIYGAVLLKQYFAVFNFGELTFSVAQKN